MIEQAGPPSKQIQATKQVQEFLKDGDDVIIIGVFSGETDEVYQLYQEAGNAWFKILEVYFVEPCCSKFWAWKVPLFILWIQ